MDVKFSRRELAFLDGVLRESCPLEENQEIRLGEGLPDIAQVICGWGQPILRGKTWSGDGVAVSGGMTIWVLYLDEEGQKQCFESWVNFAVEVPLGATTAAGQILVSCLPGVVEVRQVSPRKLTVRCTGWVNVTCLAPRKAEYSLAQGEYKDVELQKVCYPVELKTEAGEKAITLEEELKLPEGGKILCYSLETRATDQKVLTDKLVFRGSALLHILLEGEKGLQAQDFEVPFSGFAQLDKEHPEQSRGEMTFAVTGLEVEVQEDTLRLKGSLTAQYVLWDRVLLELTEDAYSPCRELEISRETIRLDVELERKARDVNAAGKIGEPGTAVADCRFFPALPRQKGGKTLGLSGCFQTLYYDGVGNLKSALTRWEDCLKLPSDEDSKVALSWGVPKAQAQVQGAQILLTGEASLEAAVSADQAFSMVTGYKLGEKLCQDPGRPSLILRRAGNGGLWDMAKESRSTMEAIRQANDLQGDPVPGQMLLIPVP